MNCTSLLAQCLSLGSPETTSMSMQLDCLSGNKIPGNRTGENREGKRPNTELNYQVGQGQVQGCSSQPEFLRKTIKMHLKTTCTMDKRRKYVSFGIYCQRLPHRCASHISRCESQTDSVPWVESKRCGITGGREPPTHPVVPQWSWSEPVWTGPTAVARVSAVAERYLMSVYGLPRGNVGRNGWRDLGKKFDRQLKGLLHNQIQAEVRGKLSPSSRTLSVSPLSDMVLCWVPD